MDEPFRQRISQPILYVLDVLRQIDAGVAVTSESIRKRFRDLVGQFDARGPYSEHFRLAKTAIVFWADELLINSSWEFAQEWKNHPLELEIYGTRSRAWLFFHNAELARGLETPDALEVFSICASLGFQGVYRSGNLRITRGAPDLSDSSSETRDRTASSAENAMLVMKTFETGEDVIAGLPATLDEWVATVFVQVLGESLTSYEPETPFDSARDAQPLTARRDLLRWTWILIGAVGLFIFLYAGRG